MNVYRASAIDLAVLLCWPANAYSSLTHSKTVSIALLHSDGIVMSTNIMLSTHIQGIQPAGSLAIDNLWSRVARRLG